MVALIIQGEFNKVLFGILFLFGACLYPDLGQSTNLERTTVHIRINQIEVKNSFSAFNGGTDNSSIVQSHQLTGQSIRLKDVGMVHIKMFNDRAFQNEGYVFDASEKMYLIVQFNGFSTGENTIFVHWIDPKGKVVNTARHIIKSTKGQSRYRTFFWLKLLRNGMFKELFSGREYKGEIHGRWNAEIFINGSFVVSQQFDVLN